MNSIDWDVKLGLCHKTKHLSRMKLIQQIPFTSQIRRKQVIKEKSKEINYWS